MDNKQANWPGILGTGAAIGGGTFAIGRLLQELMAQQEAHKRTQKQQLPDNALVIDLPGSAPSAKVANVMENTLALAAGPVAGFMGTKVLYDQWKKKQLEQEIAVANNRYMQALQAAGGAKTAAETPMVDAFCHAVAAEAEKQASLNPAALIQKLKGLVGGGAAAGQGAAGPGLFKRMAQGVGSKVKENPITAGLIGGGTGALGYDMATGNEGALSKAIGGTGDAWRTLAILSALGTTGAMVHASGKKEQAETPGIPSAVALNYQNSPQHELA